MDRTICILRSSTLREKKGSKVHSALISTDLKPVCVSTYVQSGRIERDSNLSGRKGLRCSLTKIKELLQKRVSACWAVPAPSLGNCHGPDSQLRVAPTTVRVGLSFRKNLVTTSRSVNQSPGINYFFLIFLGTLSYPVTSREKFTSWRANAHCSVENYVWYNLLYRSPIGTGL